MSADLRASIVRILKPDGGTAGTGFVITSDGLIATCAHVLNSWEGVGDRVRLSFHATMEERAARVEPEYWRDSKAEDIAILRLEETRPERAEPLVLGTSSGVAGHRFRTYGFPEDKPIQGLWGYGSLGDVTRDESGQPVLQLTGTTEVSPGFSGAPVMDELTGRIIGMVTAIITPDEHGRLTETAFVTPAEALRAVCPAVELSDIPPYRSLEAFTEEDVAFFFGRQQVVTRLVERLQREPRFLAVLGPSGSGKSSLIHAGVVPQLRQGKVPGSDRWEVISTRPAEFDQLAEHKLPGALEDLTTAVQTWLRQHPERTHVVLLVDQFEEIFISTPEPVRRTFLTQVSRLLTSSLPSTVILGMRDDFYSRFAQEMYGNPEIRGLLEWLERSLANVPAWLEPEDLTAIVEMPARGVGLRFEEGLVKRIVDDTLEATASSSERRRVAHSTVLPLLEFALTQLWDRRDDGMLTSDAYSKIGGVTGGLAQWANRAFHALPKDMRSLARHILTNLVHLGDESQGIPDSRRRQLLVALSRNATDHEVVHGVVRQLADARLLITGRDIRANQETVELIHDALLREWGLLEQWLREDRHFLVRRQEIESRARAWIETAPDDPTRREEGKLLRGRDLAEAEGWLTERRVDLGEAEQSFIQASMDLRDREQAERQRRRRWFTRVSLGAAVVFFILAGLAGWLGYRADQAATRAFQARNLAQARFLAARAQALLGENLQLAALLAVESVQMHDSLDARRALFAVLHYSPALLRYLEAGGGNGVKDVALSPDGSLAALSDGSGNVRVWSLDDGRWTLEIRAPSTEAIEFSADGRFLFRVDRAGGLERWNVVTGELEERLELDLKGFSRVYFHPDGSMVALATAEHLRFFATANSAPRSPLLSLKGLGRLSMLDFSRFSTLDFSSDGAVAALTGAWIKDRREDRALMLLRVATGEPTTEHDLLLLGQGYHRGIALSPDLATAFVDVRIVTAASNRLAGNNQIAGQHDGMRFVDVVNRKALSEPLRAHENETSVTVAKFSRDGRLAASGDGFGKIVLWDVKTRSPLGHLRGHTGTITDLAFSANGSRLLSADLNGTVLAWDLSRPAPSPLGQLVEDGNNRVLSLDFAASDSKQLLVAYSDGTVATRRVEREPVVSSLRQGRGFASAFESWTAARGDRDRLVAAADAEGRLTFWSAATGEVLSGPLEGHGKWHTAVHVHPKNGLTVSAGTDGRVRLWSPEASGWKAETLAEEDKQFTAARFSVDGEFLAVASPNKTAIWRLKPTPARLPDLEQPESGPLTVHLGRSPSPVIAWSPDGRRIAYGGADGRITLWNTATGAIEAGPVSTDKKAVLSLAFSHDGSILAAGGDNDGQIVLWDAETLQQIGPLRVKRHAVSALAFVSDGLTLASGDSNGQILLWDLSPRAWRERLCSMAHRRLSEGEWSQFLGSEFPYAPSCAPDPKLPVSSVTVPSDSGKDSGQKLTNR